MFATEVGDALKGHLRTTQRAKTAHSAIPRRVTSPQHHLLQPVLCLTAENTSGMRTNPRRVLTSNSPPLPLVGIGYQGSPTHTDTHIQVDTGYFGPFFFNVFDLFTENLTKVSLTK